MRVRLLTCTYEMARSGFIAQQIYVACDGEGQPLKDEPEDGRFWLRCPVKKDGWLPLEANDIQVLKK